MASLAVTKVGSGPIKVIAAHTWLADHQSYAPMLPFLDGERFTWAFPDQSIRVGGSLQGSGQPAARLVGTEISSGERSAVTCTALSRLPSIGEGLVIPRDSRFIDLDGEEGELKVPAGISLQEQGAR